MDKKEAYKLILITYIFMNVKFIIYLLKLPFDFSSASLSTFSSLWLISQEEEDSDWTYQQKFLVLLLNRLIFLVNVSLDSDRTFD